MGALTEFPVWLLCGFLVPISLLPEWTRPLSWALGPTWGMRAIHASAFGGAPWGDLAACYGLAIGYVALGGLLLGRMVDAARRQATLSLT
jgi:ABC-2 type transport system permease protein